MSKRETIPVGTSKAKLAAPLGIALTNSAACPATVVSSKSSPYLPFMAATKRLLLDGSVGIL